MRWPVWLPRPLAWLRAFALLALLALVAGVGRTLLFWGAVASAIFENKVLLGVAFATTWVSWRALLPTSIIGSPAQRTGVTPP